MMSDSPRPAADGTSIGEDPGGPSSDGIAVPADGQNAPDNLIGDAIAQADDASDLSDLHAALLSLSDDTFAYLDVALDHLTSSADLFDVPGIDHDDMTFDDSGA